MIGFHLSATSEFELKSLLSFRSSVSGGRHALSAAGIRAISWMIDTIVKSTSMGLYKMLEQWNIEQRVTNTLRFPPHSRTDNIIHDVTARAGDFVILHKKPSQVRECRSGDEQIDLYWSLVSHVLQGGGIILT